MSLYGLADYRRESGGEVIEFYSSREEAEAALRDALTDEPEWEADLGVVMITFRISNQ